MRRERSPRCAVDGLKADSHWSWTAAAVHGTCILYNTVVPPARTTCGNLYASGSSGLWALASRLLTTASQITRPTSPLSRFAGLCLSGPTFNVWLGRRQRKWRIRSAQTGMQISEGRQQSISDRHKTREGRRFCRVEIHGWDGMGWLGRDETR